MVSGRVQGVWFRGTTRDKANVLGVEGFARNLPDGRVEVLACGPRDQVEALCEWLWQGPSLARVDNVQCTEVPIGSGVVGFAVR